MILALCGHRPRPTHLSLNPHWQSTVFRTIPKWNSLPATCSRGQFDIILQQQAGGPDPLASMCTPPPSVCCPFWVPLLEQWESMITELIIVHNTSHPNIKYSSSIATSFFLTLPQQIYITFTNKTNLRVCFAFNCRKIKVSAKCSLSDSDHPLVNFITQFDCRRDIKNKLKALIVSSMNGYSLCFEVICHTLT